MQDLFPSRAAGPFGRRLRHARGARIPVAILTGFLGAGKTTLLQRFLATPEGSGTAVVINEFGAEGIDDQLVRQSSEETVLLGNGCVCCTTRSDLQIALRRLVAERERGLVPDFRRVVIETSGLADPGPLLATFATDRALGAEFSVDVVIAVADAVTGSATLEWSAEARKQVILADRLVITKGDLAEPDPIEALEARLRALNPHAAVERSVHGRLDPRAFTEPVDATRSSRQGFVAEAEHSDGIVSFVLRETEQSPGFRSPRRWKPSPPCAGATSCG
jgi:G3E family GTPase